MGVLRATDDLFPPLLLGTTGSPHTRSSSAMTVGSGGGVGTAAVGWMRCVVPLWLGPSRLGTGHQSHCRVLGWGSSGGKEQMPAWAFQERGGCCQDWWCQAGSLGSQTALERAQILPKYFFHWVGATSCHSFLLEHPFWHWGHWSLHHLSPPHIMNLFIHQATV